MASKFFCGLFTPKSSPSSSSSSSATSKRPKEKLRWSFLNCYRKKNRQHHHNGFSGHHEAAVAADQAAIAADQAAVAADQAAVAADQEAVPADQAAVAADQAAVAIFPLTNGTSSLVAADISERGAGNREELAVVRIQSAFRGYLARKALRALKGLVKLQALVRGHIERKRTAECLHRMRTLAAYVSERGTGIREEWAAIKIQSVFRGSLARQALRALKGVVKFQALVRGHIQRKWMAECLHRMQALMRAQARAIHGRCQVSKFRHSSSSKSSNSENSFHTRPVRRGFSSSNLSQILARKASRVLKGLVKFQALVRGYIQRKWMAECLHRMQALMRAQARAIDGRCQVSKFQHSSSSESSNPGPTTPEKRRNLSHSSDSAIASDLYSHGFTASKASAARYAPKQRPRYKRPSLMKRYSDYPNYMARTESSKAKVVSLRAPKQRPGYERSSSMKRYSDYANYMACTESSKAKVVSLRAPKQRPGYERSSSMKRYSDYANYMACTESSKAKVRSLKLRPQYERLNSTQRYLEFTTNRANTRDCIVYSQSGIEQGKLWIERLELPGSDPQVSSII